MSKADKRKKRRRLDYSNCPICGKRVLDTLYGEIDGDRVTFMAHKRVRFAGNKFLDLEGCAIVTKGKIER